MVIVLMHLSHAGWVCGGLLLLEGALFRVGLRCWANEALPVWDQRQQASGTASAGASEPDAPRLDVLAHGVRVAFRDFAMMWRVGWETLNQWGDVVTRIEPLAGGVANDVWSLNVDGQLAVGRLGARSDEDLAWETDLLQYLDREGLTVPVPIPTIGRPTVRQTASW